MKFKNALKTTASIIKDEPINMDERIELLEKKLNTKISQFEDSMSTIQSILIKLSDENSILKEENMMLKKMISDRETVSTSLLDGIKTKLVKPIMKEGQEFAELVFKEDIEEQDNKEKPRQHIVKPETELGKNKKNKDPNPLVMEEHTPKNKTIKWMRQKFGLTPQIAEKKSKKSRKR